MRFKVGDLVLNRLGSEQGEEVDCEGIIVEHWQTKSMFRNGMDDNVVLYITLDRSWPHQTGKLDTMRNFKESKWELKKPA